jgi:signal transduction histidine kinase
VRLAVVGVVAAQARRRVWGSRLCGIARSVERGAGEDAMHVQRQVLLAAAHRVHNLWRAIVAATRLLMGKRLTRGPLLALAALGCTLILTNSLIAYTSVRTLMAQQHAVIQSHAVQTSLEQLTASLDEAETGERGYILSGNESDLAPYTSAVAQLPRDIDQITGLVAGDAAQRRRMAMLTPLIEERLAELRTLINLKRDGTDTALRSMIAMESKETTDSIHQVLSDMEAEEQGLLAAQDLVAQASTNATYITLGVATLVDIALLIAIVYLAGRALARREQVAQERAELLTQEQAARQVAESAVRARDEFLSIASHELRSPLTVLLGSAQTLQRRVAREGGMSERSLQTLAVIPQQASRLRALIEAMLDVTRIEQGQLTLATGPLDLAAVVRRVVEEARATTDLHTLTCEGAQQPIYVTGDAVRLEQVLHNLVENAIKYSPHGGEIRVRLARRGTQVEVAVNDEGIGIPAAAQAQLFKRFYRAPNASAAHISGTGIGLYVIREIVTLHEGTIAVASMEGCGSTFTVSLPELVMYPTVEGPPSGNGHERAAPPTARNHAPGKRQRGRHSFPSRRRR